LNGSFNGAANLLKKLHGKRPLPCQPWGQGFKREGNVRASEFRNPIEATGHGVVKLIHKPMILQVYTKRGRKGNASRLSCHS